MTRVIWHSAGGWGEFAERKVVEFDGGSGSGAVGTVILFTVTGGVKIAVDCVCTESLTEAGATATVEVGTAGTTNGLIATTDAVDIDVGEVWRDNTPAPLEAMAGFGGAYIGDGADIILTVGAQDVDDGMLEFTCFWTPLTNDGNVVAA